MANVRINSQALSWPAGHSPNPHLIGKLLGSPVVELRQPCSCRDNGSCRDIFQEIPELHLTDTVQCSWFGCHIRDKRLLLVSKRKQHGIYLPLARWWLLAVHNICLPGEICFYKIHSHRSSRGTQPYNWLWYTMNINVSHQSSYQCCTT